MIDPIEQIAAYASQHPNFFMVQVGAYDGIHGDPIHNLVLQYRWKGLLIEPQKRAFDKLPITYAGLEGLVFENVAIGNTEGEQTFYEIGPGKNDAKIYGQLHSFNKEVILKHADRIPDLEDRIIETKVRTTTLPILFRAHHIQHIDLLQIDTEGYDFEVIKQLDFKIISPAMIHFEHYHLSKTDYADCCGLLQKYGYELSSNKYNTLAIQKQS